MWESQSTEYKTWTGMRDRCMNPNNPTYKYYGGRGIRVCERWQVYANFLEDMGRRPANKDSIDRINNDGNYEPRNCRWATWATQGANRRSQPCVAELAREVGMSRQILWHRLNVQGMSLDMALSTPIRGR